MEKYLKILSRQYKNEREVISEIVNLQAIMSLPKGTEHFLTDIHGEAEQFSHVLRNGSGSIRRKIEEVFGFEQTSEEKRSLATLIYYPKEKLDIVKKTQEDINDWYLVTLHRLVAVLKRVSSKYTRSKVRKAMSKDFAYLIEELITEKEEILNKQAYYNKIILSVIKVGAAEALIISICNLIQHLSIDHLHIIGDFFDRGAGPHKVIDMLINYHSLDIQWGNHDVVWMGAAAGNLACIANVVRLCARYNNLEVLEEGYGINLTPFVSFLIDVYGNHDRQTLHKAAAIMQFKLEDKIINDNPDLLMNERTVFNKINFEDYTYTIDGNVYQLNCKDFPTINKENPSKLSLEEEELLKRLKYSFTHSEKLQSHVKFLYEKGNLYKIFNSNLLYHGCMPMDDEGNFLSLKINGKELKGKQMFDELEIQARNGYFCKQDSPEKIMGETFLWYLWEGTRSPLFGKSKMATFESLFIDDKKARKEIKNPYYKLLEKNEIVDKILLEFNLDTNKSHIINGHVPQEIKNGDSPIKCQGKLLIIDGGFAAAYHEKTGIAGYTLVCNSYGLHLVVHKKFTSKKEMIANDSDIVSDTITVEKFPVRMMVANTDIGKQIEEQINDLEELLKAYRS